MEVGFVSYREHRDIFTIVKSQPEIRTLRVFLRLKTPRLTLVLLLSPIRSDILSAVQGVIKTAFPIQTRGAHVLYLLHLIRQNRSI